MKQVLLVFAIFSSLSSIAQIVPIPPIETGPSRGSEATAKCGVLLNDAIKHEKAYVEASGKNYISEKSFFALLNKEIFDTGLNHITKQKDSVAQKECPNKQDLEILKKVVSVYIDGRACKDFIKRREYIEPIQRLIKIHE